ncbi:hypothetical protein [Paenibacillus daejeonensis]|uniref:hypothetical protein n=1 Tax=Paenibacillus daejeonensis TaxID=135193 RepID=UPI0012FCBFD3|nr:hypothetical protein [Paenibacillus daejeonensis]
MKKTKMTWVATASLALMLTLVACSDTNDQPANANGPTNTEATSGTNEQPAPEDTPTTSSSASDELPAELPDDFPLPEDAVITFANSGENEGKKSAMVIFTSEEDMKTVSQLYKQYFDDKGMTDAASLLDDKNIIIQGTDPNTQQHWSVIGGAMASREGVIELTVNWSES